MATHTAFDRIRAALDARRAGCTTPWCVFDAASEEEPAQMALYVEDDPKRRPLRASRVYSIEGGYLLEILRDDGVEERIGSPHEPLPPEIGPALRGDGLPLVFVTRRRGGFILASAAILFLKGSWTPLPRIPRPDAGKETKPLLDLAVGPKN